MLTSLANDLLNDSLQLDNGLLNDALQLANGLVDMCSARSVRKEQTLVNLISALTFFVIFFIYIFFLSFFLKSVAACRFCVICGGGRWSLGCLQLRQWPVTYLITFSDWTMSCQPGPPRACRGQWPRWQQRPVGYTFPYKMANFHCVYLKLDRIDSAEFFISYSEKCLPYCHKNLKWYDEPMLCYRRVKICNFAMSKQVPSHYFHLHAWAPPTASPQDV